jgi:hypothetical protein
MNVCALIDPKSATAGLSNGIFMSLPPPSLNTMSLGDPLENMLRFFAAADNSPSVQVELTETTVNSVRAPSDSGRLWVLSALESLNARLRRKTTVLTVTRTQGTPTSAGLDELVGRVLASLTRRCADSVRHVHFSPMAA